MNICLKLIVKVLLVIIPDGDPPFPLHKKV
jgi:hypothetical protein